MTTLRALSLLESRVLGVLPQTPVAPDGLTVADHETESAVYDDPVAVGPRAVHTVDGNRGGGGSGVSHAGAGPPAVCRTVLACVLSSGTRKVPP